MTSDVPGIVCPGVCSLPWDADSLVQLGVQADPGYAFAGWEGACSGSSVPCSLALGSDTAVTARFGRPGALQVRVVGHGTVDQCTTRCTRAVVGGQQLTLTARPKASARFLRWEGACHGRAPECSIVAEPGTTVRAVFGS